MFYFPQSFSSVFSSQDEIGVTEFYFFSGFDFDLDEVWAPLNPHLRSLKSTSSTPRYTYLNFRAKNSLVVVFSIL